MRTGPVALLYLNDPEALVEAARSVGGLTHADPYAQDACVLWSLAILYAEFDLRAGLARLDRHAAAYWTQRLDEAEQCDPGRFRPTAGRSPRCRPPGRRLPTRRCPSRTPADTCPTHSPRRSESATTPTPWPPSPVRCSAPGGGPSAIPAQWRRISRGYPGLTGERLVELAHLAACGGRPGAYGWPTVDHIDYSGHGVPTTLVRHPLDDGVWLADASALDDLPDDVTAVVSLCLVGRQQIRTDLVHINYRLIDKPDYDANPNLDFLLADAARTIAALRDEGHRVLLHRVAAQSRTPTVAIAYAMHRGIERDAAYRSILGALPAASPNPAFRAALRRLEHDEAFARRIATDD